MNESEISRVLEEEAERFEKEKDKDASHRYVTPRPAAEPSQVYSVRIPVSRIEELRALATREGKQPSAMIRDWILRRLDVELQHEGMGKIIPFSNVKSHVDLSRSHSEDWHQLLRACGRVIDHEIERRSNLSSKTSARQRGPRSIIDEPSTGSR